jgi:hypothetical protein
MSAASTAPPPRRDSETRGAWWFPSAPTGMDHDNEKNYAVDRLDPSNNFHGSLREFRGVALGVFHEAGLLRHFNISNVRALRFFDRVYASYDADGAGAAQVMESSRPPIAASAWLQPSFEPIYSVIPSLCFLTCNSCAATPRRRAFPLRVARAVRDGVRALPDAAAARVQPRAAVRVGGAGAVRGGDGSRRRALRVGAVQVAVQGASISPTA